MKLKFRVKGKLELESQPEETLSALVFKTMAITVCRKLTLFRVYSGVVKSDSHFFFLPEPGGKNRGNFS